MRTKYLLPVAASVTLTSLLAACGSDTLDPGGAATPSAHSSTAVNVTADETLANLVPDDVKKSGTLTIGTNASYAPIEFTENGNQIKGLDVDLMTTVGQKLGLKVTFQNGNFDSLIGGVSSGKYQMAASAFTINSERLQQVNMVQYLNAGSLWATTKTSTKTIDPKNACGLTVGVQKGTVQVDEVNAKNKECTKAKKPSINIVVEDSQSKVTADLMAGKVDAMAADSPVAAWAVAQNSQALKEVGTMYDSAPYGFVTAKSDTQLAQAISKALASLKKDGSYDKILDNWGNKSGAVKEFPINPNVGG